MKIIIWVFTGHLSTLNMYIEDKKYRPELSGKEIDWLKFPDSIGTVKNSLLYCQVQLSYEDF